MAKAKAGRAKGRRAAGPRRATSAAKSRKSKKSPKRPAKAGSKPRRRPARKAAVRRRTAPASARSTAKRRRPAVKPVKAARAAKTARRVVKKANRKVVKAAARKTPARKPPLKSSPARTAAAVRKPKAPVPPRARPAAVAVVVKPAPVRAPRKAAASVHGRLPALDRERRRLPEADVVPSPPSSLDLNRTPSAARSGQAEIAEHLADHTETGPELTGGDVDASWESAYSTGDEAPGGDNPTPDQDVVDDIGRSLGLVYEDTEELKGADKITERDKHRWELDPASAEDFEER